MPKIIEHLDDRLLEEAGKQLESAGYSAMTIRSVAKACGVGVGTVYNYYPSKDILVASYLLSDWNGCVRAIHAVSDAAESPEPVMAAIVQQLLAFAGRHQAIFRDEAAAAGFSGSFGSYHATLRGQLAQPLRRFCDDDFTAEFAAEALLTWTMAGRSFDELHGILRKLF